MGQPIYDIHGNVVSARVSPDLAPIYTLPGMRINAATPDGRNMNDAQWDRIATQQRQECRAAYVYNPIMKAALGIRKSFVIGADFNHGQMDDEAAQEVMEDFFTYNNIARFMQNSLCIEMMTDGDFALILDDDTNPRSNRFVGRDVPSAMSVAYAERIQDYTYSHSRGGFMTQIEVGSSSQDTVTYDSSEFYHFAHDNLWGRATGLPMVRGAPQLADQYLNFTQIREGIHALQGRIHLVLKHLLPNINNLDAQQVYKDKLVDAMPQIPRDGAILHLFKDSDGNSEEAEFPKIAQGAGDGEKDATLIRQAFCIAAGVSDILLGISSTMANRSTANVIARSLVEIYKLQQDAIRTMFNEILRLECRRRLGEGRLYRQGERKKKGRGNRHPKVPLARLNFPIIMPSLEEQTEDRLRLALDAGAEPEEILDKLGGFTFNKEVFDARNSTGAKQQSEGRDPQDNSNQQTRSKE